MTETSRPAYRDTAVMAGAFLCLYLVCLLPGVGWGATAHLQAACAAPGEPPAGLYEGYEAPPSPPAVYAAICRPFARFFPGGSPAWRVNLFSALAAVAALAVFATALGFLTAHRSSAVLAVTALGFSHAFFFHAVHPSPRMLLFLFAAVLHLASLRILLLGCRRSALLAALAALACLAIDRSSSLAILVPLHYIVLRRFLPSAPLFWLLAAVAVFGAMRARLGFHFDAYPLLVAYSAFQYPVAAWVLLIWGYLLLRRRSPAVLDWLVLSWLAAAPLAAGRELEELAGSMILALLPLGALVALGLEYVHDRIRLRTEIRPVVTPLLFVSLVVFPLVATGAATYAVRASGLDRHWALADAPPVTVRDNPWRDAVWYALWPPKNGEGGGRFIADAEEHVPEGSVILADPSILPVVDYAQRAEGRLRGVRVLSAALDDQMPHLVSFATEGRRIFLAGIDPAYYDTESLGRMGELIPIGRLYEWRMAL